MPYTCVMVSLRSVKTSNIKQSLKLSIGAYKIMEQINSQTWNCFLEFLHV